MKNVRSDAYDYIIDLINLNYNVQDISKCLNLEESYVLSTIKNIRKEVVNSLNERQFSLIGKIDKLLGREVRYVTKNFGGTKRNSIFRMLISGKSSLEMMSELNIDLSKYLSLLKAMYIDLVTYGNEEEKEYIPLIQKCIDEVTGELRRGNVIKKYSTENIPKKEMLVQSGMNGEDVECFSYVGNTVDLGNHEDLKFLVISDTHIGSKFENMDYIKQAYEYAAKNGIRYILHAGDLIEGCHANYDRCQSQYKSVDAQLSHVMIDYPYDMGIKNIILLGNHDATPMVKGHLDIAETLEKREDFVVSGYRSSYLKVKDEYIALKHEVSRMKNDINDATVLLNFLGHSHNYQCSFDGRHAVFRVPTLSDMKSSQHVVNKGFLVGNVSLEDGKAKDLSVKYINLEDEKVIGFERQLKK